MRGSSKINHRPYLPLNRYKEIFCPYICRIAPNTESVEIEWFDNGSDGIHIFFYGKRGEEAKFEKTITENIIHINGLEKETEYEFYIEADNGNKSRTRLFRTGEIPGDCSVINYLHPEDTYYDFSGRYLGSPSIVRTKSGRLVASMDLFLSFKPQNLTLTFYSDDNGKTWRYLNDIYRFFWPTLFYYKDVLYIIGVTTEYGDLRIACSYDEGVTWSEAKTIFYGSNFSCIYGGIHRPPMQIVSYKGRLYTTFEYGCWEHGSHLPSILSIDENADLMNPENWTATEVLPFEGEWAKMSEKQGDTIEGNIVCAPDGNLYSFMRYKVGEMLKIRVNTEEPEKMPEFVDVVKAPVSNAMFRIVPHKDKYLLITNRKTPESAKHDCWTYRNVLSVFESYDLENFTFVKDIFNFEHIHPEKVGFQYPNFLYDGSKLSLMVRSAFNEPDNAHNSNYMLFCKDVLSGNNMGDDFNSGSNDMVKTML